MSISTVERTAAMRLRQEAEALLKAGTAPAGGGCAIGVDTLRLLHQLSSDPARAGDALKLLHELQVHQVELDMQGKQLASAESELAGDLAHYRELFEHAPLAYFVVDGEGAIIEANCAAAHQVGVDNGALRSCRFDSFVAPDNVNALEGAMERLSRGSQQEIFGVQLRGVDGSAHPMRVTACRGPVGGYMLLACCPCEDELLTGAPAADQ